jgi:HSP20 family molecular chaperone IbpA
MVADMTDRPSHREVLEATAEAADGRPQRVPVNVYEAPNALVVIAPLPAVMPGDVQVELRPGRLRFWASLRSSGPREYLINEWDYGNYEREIELPSGYGSGVEASLANGQLAIRVLKGAPVDQQTIQPTVGASS